MTLGKKLSGYRKLAGLTQQQLGEHLNLSAQAISKWEKDMTEPDLTTLRALAELYKVTLDELIDLNKGFAGANIPEDEEEDAQKESTAQIGFCKDCGIVVREENLGQTEPVILCKKCVSAREEKKKREAEMRKRAAEEAQASQKRALAKNRASVKRLVIKSVIWASLATALFVACMIAAMAKSFQAGMIPTTLVGIYVVFSFVFCLFYDCWVRDVIWEWSSKAFHAPGLIFTFDLDGCLWMIGMKILFWVIGILFGFVVGAIGITLGVICAPFVFPYVVFTTVRAYKKGENAEFLEA